MKFYVRCVNARHVFNAETFQQQSFNNKQVASEQLLMDKSTNFEVQFASYYRILVITD